MDYNDNYGNEISPHLAVLTNLTTTSQLYASYNRAHRAPSLSDRYVKWCNLGMCLKAIPSYT